MFASLALAAVMAQTRECPPIAGKWVSPTYMAHRHNTGGAYDQLTGLSMSLTIEMLSMEDCAFKATNEWTNGVVGGSEFAVGIVHKYPMGSMTLVERPDAPTGGTTGQFELMHTPEGKLEVHYSGRASTHATVFDTELTMECKHCDAGRRLLFGASGGDAPCC